MPTSFSPSWLKRCIQKRKRAERSSSEVEDLAEAEADDVGDLGGVVDDQLVEPVVAHGEDGDSARLIRALQEFCLRAVGAAAAPIRRRSDSSASPGR